MHSQKLYVNEAVAFPQKGIPTVRGMRPVLGPPPPEPPTLDDDAPKPRSRAGLGIVILFHAPWAYGVNMGFWLSLFAGLAVSLGKTGRLQFELGKQTKGGSVEEIHPSVSFAAFYWWVRYRSVLHEDDCHEARDYHHHRNLEGAIRL